MAELITAKGAAHHIEQIMTGASERLTLVSPYLKLSDVFVQRLQAAARRSATVTVVHRDGELPAPERKKLRTVGSLRLLGLPNLHAKCYANEREMVITSMNLYSTSEQNWEMGVRATVGDPLYDAAMRELDAIVAAARSSSSGTCIRCSTEIAYDPTRPLCLDCYDVWSIFRNADYGEVVCHRCGEPAPTSMRRPLCVACGGATYAGYSATGRSSL